jgi:hypothetical protein
MDGSEATIVRKPNKGYRFYSVRHRHRRRQREKFIEPSAFDAGRACPLRTSQKLRALLLQSTASRRTKETQ